MLEQLIEWRAAFLEHVASKNHVLAPAFIAYVSKAPTTEEEAVGYQAACIRFMRRYESMTTSVTGERGRKNPLITLRGLATTLYAIEAAEEEEPETETSTEGQE